MKSLPKLPQLLERKLYKTGQTRGADDDVIFQNRVSRTSTVLIPYEIWPLGSKPSPNEDKFEKGFIVLISPNRFFLTKDIVQELSELELKIGENALVFYETREQWNLFNPENMNWKPAENRITPLGGQYVARVPGTTAIGNGNRIIRGFNSTSNKGAGIRVYEYASSSTILNCRLQLEILFWLCYDAQEILIKNGMEIANIKRRRSAIFRECQEKNLLDKELLRKSRTINLAGKTICPLCLKELSAEGFFTRMEQAEGRQVPDLTVTQLNLFHIEELRIGVFNHRIYNLGWGHHHCNVVVKDSGIRETIEWMDEVIQRNIEQDYYSPSSRQAKLTF